MMEHLDKKKFVKRIVLDVVAALFCIGGFLLYYYVMPQTNQGAGTAILSTEEVGKTTFSLPEADQENVSSAAEKQGVEKQGAEKQGVEKQGAEKQDAVKQSAEKQNAEKQDAEKQNAEKQNTEEQDVAGETLAEEPGKGDSAGGESSRNKPPGGVPGSQGNGQSSGQSSGQSGRKSSSQGGNKSGMGSGNTNTKSISSNEEDTKELLNLAKADTALESYRDDVMQLTIKKTQLGEGNDTITYYTADVYLTSPEQLKTAFAAGSFGKNLRESTLAMAEDNEAVLAISGDSYGNNETGIVVRNGILYREETNDGEICVMFADGTMKIYTPAEFDTQQILAENVWQVWNFGPSLLEDGEVKGSFQTTSYLNVANPRCAIGYVSPGHYKFVLVDGRNIGYSKGATMSELAQIMKEEGCELAYNLDGGKSSAMVYQGAYVNQPADGGRDISDIIYIGKTKG